MDARPRRARALVGGALLLVLAVLSGRMLLGARGELALAAAARAQGDRDGELRHLRRAFAYYLPANPWLRRAHDQLLALSREADRQGERATALTASLELRGAILGLRGLNRPFAGTLPELDARIARLLGSEGGVRGPSVERLRERLGRPPEPDPLWAGLGLLGFGAWTAAAFLLCAFAIHADASLERRRFWPLLLVVLGGQLLFWAGMARA
jgi:hypothetical protein